MTDGHANGVATYPSQRNVTVARLHLELGRLRQRELELEAEVTRLKRAEECLTHEMLRAFDGWRGEEKRPRVLEEEVAVMKRVLEMARTSGGYNP